MLKKKEIRALSPAEMDEKIAEFKKTLSREKGQVASGTRPENPGNIRALRRSVARIMTIRNEQKKITGGHA